VRKTIWFLILLLLSSGARADEPLLDRPHWSLEIKGGVFAPALKDWPRYYGKHDMPEYAVSLAYKLLRQVELGAGIGTMSATGQAYNPLHGTPSGEASYELEPVTVFIMLRGSVKDEQWLVPYIGGGWTRMYYKEQMKGQETVRGTADGYHIRGGVQLSLDHLDPSASSGMYADYGVYSTYFFMEAEYTRAVERTTSNNLGGTAYLGGLLFEF